MKNLLTLISILLIISCGEKVVREEILNNVYETNVNIIHQLNTTPTYWGEKP